MPGSEQTKGAFMFLKSLGSTRENSMKMEKR